MCDIEPALNTLLHIRNVQNDINQKSIREDESYIHPLGQKKDTPIGVSSLRSNPQ